MDLDHLKKLVDDSIVECDKTNGAGPAYAELQRYMRGQIMPSREEYNAQQKLRQEVVDALDQLKDAREIVNRLERPVHMRLTCPDCGVLHVDEGEFETKPHHTHACQHCGAVWRPAIVHTVGVRFLPGFRDEFSKPQKVWRGSTALERTCPSCGVGPRVFCQSVNAVTGRPVGIPISVGDQGPEFHESRCW